MYKSRMQTIIVNQYSAKDLQSNPIKCGQGHGLHFSCFFFQFSTLADSHTIIIILCLH